ncbi:hypothetical protein ACFYTC_32310 [Actinomadura nitritigenes]|uniref:hypothetical protein n=1 Tax=Actinomadura nitritigenes TaxID=134602 RepID=UPI0036AE6F2E
MNSHDRRELAGADLTDLVNVGRAVAGYFARVGITRSDTADGQGPDRTVRADVGRLR